MSFKASCLYVIVSPGLDESTWQVSPGIDGVVVVLGQYPVAIIVQEDDPFDRVQTWALIVKENALVKVRIKIHGTGLHLRLIPPLLQTVNDTWSGPLSDALL